MEILKSIEDYLLEEIQKYLNLIEQETTDVTYNKLTLEVLELYISDDNIGYIRNLNNFQLEKFNEDYLDYSKKDTIFTLESILNTVKYINNYLKNKIIDNPKLFFYKVLKKYTISDVINKTLYVNENKKTKIEDKNNLSITIKLK